VSSRRHSCSGQRRHLRRSLPSRAGGRWLPLRGRCVARVALPSAHARFGQSVANAETRPGVMAAGVLALAFSSCWRTAWLLIAGSSRRGRDGTDSSASRSAGSPRGLRCHPDLADLGPARQRALGDRCRLGGWLRQRGGLDFPPAWRWPSNSLNPVRPTGARSTHPTWWPWSAPARSSRTANSSNGRTNQVVISKPRDQGGHQTGRHVGRNFRVRFGCLTGWGCMDGLRHGGWVGR
jgi:hypothetical protein